MKPAPDLSEAQVLHKRIFKHPSRVKPESGLVAFFASPVRAFLGLFGLVVLALVPYLLVHFIHKPTPFEPASAVQLSPDGTFKPFFLEGELERFFSKAQINDLEKRLGDKAAELSQRELERRRSVFLPAIQATKELLPGYNPPGVLGRDTAKVTDEDLLREDLSILIPWLTNNPGRFAPENRALFQELAQQFIALDLAEERIREQLRAESAALKPPLPFGWLFTEGAWWTIEVLVWSFLGVLANSIIGLILACRRSAYAPSEFVLVIPKIFLAPLLAFVIIAFWSTGFSESKITYLSLPYFLVMSFLLGFVTEGLYEKLRDLANLVVTPAATVSEQKVQDATRDEPYRFQNPTVRPGDQPPPRTLDEVRDQLRSVVKARLERSVVARTAVNEPTPTGNP